MPTDAVPDVAAVFDLLDQDWLTPEQLGMGPEVSGELLAAARAGRAAFRAEAAVRLRGRSRAGELGEWVRAQEWEAALAAARQVSPVGGNALGAWAAVALPEAPAAGRLLAWTLVLRQGAGRGRADVRVVPPPPAVAVQLPLVAGLVDATDARRLVGALIAGRAVPEEAQTALEEAIRNLRTRRALDALRAGLTGQEAAELSTWASAQAAALGVPFDPGAAEIGAD